MICGQNWDTEDEKSGRNGDICPTWFAILKQYSCLRSFGLIRFKSMKFF